MFLRNRSYNYFIIDSLCKNALKIAASFIKIFHLDEDDVKKK